MQITLNNHPHRTARKPIGGSNEVLSLNRDLGQHFTPASICRMMMQHVPAVNPAVVTDLAMGQGELLWHAKQKWPYCQIIGFDIDSKLVKHCRSRLGLDGVYERMDVLKASPLKARDRTIAHSLNGGVDVALSNPPFGITPMKELEPTLSKMLNDHDLLFSNNGNGKLARTEIAFFLRDLQVISLEGYIAILLPESAISGVKTQSFRRFLLNHTRLHLILSLPPNSFHSAEARICLLVTQKKEHLVNKRIFVSIGIVDSKMKTVQTAKVDQHRLISRMDPKYYTKIAELRRLTRGWETLGDYVHDCSRGYGLYGSERRLFNTDGDLTYIHSINIANFIVRRSEQPTVPGSLAKHHPQALVHEKDVLLVRVGKGCIGRCAIASKMSRDGFASDCVYIIRSQRIDPYYLCLFLNTSFAKDYVNSCRRGVCSQYITKLDVMALPIFIPGVETIHKLSTAFRKILDQMDCSDDTSQHILGLSLLTRQLDALIYEKRPILNDNHRLSY